MTIEFLLNYFNNHKLFKTRFYDNVIYLFARNSLRLGHIKQYDEKSCICYYRAGKDNGKEHNLILKGEMDLEILIPYLKSIFGREYEGTYEIVSETPVIKIKGEEYYQTQKFYKKRIPKKELNLTKK